MSRCDLIVRCFRFPSHHAHLIAGVTARVLRLKHLYIVHKNQTRLSAPFPVGVSHNYWWKNIDPKCDFRGVVRSRNPHDIGEGDVVILFPPITAALVHSFTSNGNSSNFDGDKAWMSCTTHHPTPRLLVKKKLVGLQKFMALVRGGCARSRNFNKCAQTRSSTVFVFLLPYIGPCCTSKARAMEERRGDDQFAPAFA